MTKIHEYPDDATSKPITGDDYIDMDNTDDGGLTWNVSKKIKVSELLGFAGLGISESVIAIGNATSDGIEDSTGKAGGVSGYPDDFVLAHADYHNDSDYALWQDRAALGGTVYYNSPLAILMGVGGTINYIKITNNLVELLAGSSQQKLEIGNNPVSPIDTKVYIKGPSGGDYILGLADSSNELVLSAQGNGLVFLRNGTGINEFSTDGTFAGDSDEAVPTEKAVKTYVDAQSGGGWLGSATRIKIAPWDIVSYNDKDGVSIQDDGGVVNDAAAKITTMVTGVFIPTGYRATAFKINASANIAVELFESQVWDSTAVSKGSGNANTEINITNVDSTNTNYLNIIIVEAGNDIYGGYITIEKI